jgi:hypothetical protein
MIAKNKVRWAKKVRRTFVAMWPDSRIAIGNFFVSEACFAEGAVCQVLRLNDRFGPVPAIGE